MQKYTRLLVGASCAKAGMDIAAATQDAPISSLVYVFMVSLLDTEKCSPC